ncbi:hypothetical protein [Methanolobus sp. WCC5]|uniref:hypothetical protein n=1 Tax=Methanolobus sp. WCC5 TaxID=3125785 RepID=UPI003246CF15
MRIITTFFIVVCLYAAGATGYIIADNQPEIENLDRFSDTSIYTNMQESQDLDFFNESLADFNVSYDYQRRVYDCREFSAVLDHHLKKRGFDCGLVRIAYDDHSGHRINWVRIDNETLIIEPQTSDVMTLDDLQNRYPKNIIAVTLLDYDIEVSKDKRFYYEN